MTECESASALSSPAPGGLPTLHRDKQRSLVVFQEVRWAKRKHRARNTQQEDGKKGWRDVCSMKNPQHLFTQGLDKNVTLGGKGTGSTDYVIIFWLSADLAEAKKKTQKKRSRLWFCCCSVTTLYPTLCNPMDCNTPVFPVLHYLPEFAQTHVH